jgi:septal ring-binding cell division protein DamX
MDGSRTILEMCGQLGLDAATLGPFALFLREMGWAKLFELPPIDRKGLNEALTVPDPTKPPSSIPVPSPREELFKRIEDAAAPTTSLDHLAKAIDDLGDLPSGPPPTAPEKPDTTGPAAMPHTPPWSPETSLEHTGDPEDYVVGPAEGPPEQVGRVIIAPEPGTEDGPPGRSIVIGDGPGEPDGAAEEPTKPAKAIKVAKAAKAPKPTKAPKTLKVRRRSGGKAAVLVIVALLGASALLAAWWVARTFGRRQPPFTLPLDDHPHEGAAPAKEPARPGGPAATKAPAPPVQEAPKPQAPPVQDAPKTQAPPVQEAPKAQAPPVQEAPKAQAPPVQEAPKTQTQTPARPQPDEPQLPAPDISAAARFAAISQGNASTAVEQGKAYRDRLPKSAWTIRLVVAEQRDTLRNCARALDGGGHDVFLMPLKMRNGRSCYQLFLGNFPTRLSAEAELKRLPEFLQKGSPTLMQVAEIVAEQQQ